MKKKWQTRLFKLSETLFINKKKQQKMMPTWVGAGQKFDFFVQKSWFFCNSKHFRQSIMTPCYSCYFSIFYIFNSFQIMMVSLFLAPHDQYLIIFKDSNVFEFSNFSFQQSIIMSVNSNYLFSRRKQEKTIVETILW